MKFLTIVVLIGFVVSARGDGQSNGVHSAVPARDPVETIVCLRHGEKPRSGLGQLTCRGLNRALALPDVLLAKFGTPQFVFAPNPAPKHEGAGDYNYVRPLMTIEPTAIRCGLPVNTQFGFKEINGLAAELQKPEYQSATVFVVWEHALLDEFVKNLLKSYGGDPAQVPNWPGDDFDTIFVVTITRSGAGPSVAFAIDHEQLNHLSDTCPASDVDRAPIGANGVPETPPVRQ